MAKRPPIRICIQQLYHGKQDSNAKVAAVLLPNQGNADNSVRFKGEVKKSALPIADFGQMIIRKLPQMAPMFENANPEEIFIYEINYSEVQVTIGMNPPEVIKF